VAEVERQNKEQIQGKISGALEEKRRREEELEQLRSELSLAEADEKRRQADREMYEKSMRDRAEMMQANEYQKALRQAQNEARDQEEQQFREEMMVKFAEDERIEQLNAQARRRRTMEHKQEVERLIKEKRAMYEREKQKEEAERAHQAAVEAEEAHIIEQERQRLLSEHAAALNDYLPKGVLKKPEDKRIVGL
jgi:hypothetical protein